MFTMAPPEDISGASRLDAEQAGPTRFTESTRCRSATVTSSSRARCVTRRCSPGRGSPRPRRRCRRGVAPSPSPMRRRELARPEPAGRPERLRRPPRRCMPRLAPHPMPWAAPVTTTTLPARLPQGAAPPAGAGQLEIGMGVTPGRPYLGEPADALDVECDHVAGLQRRRDLLAGAPPQLREATAVPHVPEPSTSPAAPRPPEAYATISSNVQPIWDSRSRPTWSRLMNAVSSRSRNPSSSRYGSSSSAVTSHGPNAWPCPFPRPARVRRASPPAAGRATSR